MAPTLPSFRFRRATAALLLGALAACGGGGTTDAPRQTPLSAAASLGEKIFHDPSLSASGRLSCASCHDPASAHAPANDLPVQLGGALGDRQGLRKAPSLRYLASNRAFGIDADGTPVGGFFWDGRAASLAEQAASPLLDPHEMANADRAAVVARLARAGYAGEFRALYGAAVFDDVDGAFRRLTLALERYQLEDAAFNAYTSKYDEFLRGRARLSEQELRGLALFNSPAKGNCAACHPSARAADGALPLFTDFSFDNLGVPRNAELSRNADPAYFDLGLCGRAELAARTELCGTFRVPSLRNVAERRAFFHNGRFKTLEETLAFYVQRETNPEKWYPLDERGEPRKYDDLPAAYRANVNTSEAPYDRRRGDAPALSDAEIGDLIAFLKTLSDQPRDPGP
jgi:cytochrome c peroxidase